MRLSNKPPEEREISVAITTGNKSSVGGVVIGGDLYQNCTIILQDIKTSSDTKDLKDVKGQSVRISTMSNSNKVWCDVWDGAIYRERCLYHLGKIARENKTCLGCICYEKMQLEERLEQIRSSKRARKKEKSGKEAREPMQKPDQEPDQFYTSNELVKLFGRSLRRIQEWAKVGKIPAEKNGPHYRFPKAEINGLLKKE